MLTPPSKTYDEEMKETPWRIDSSLTGGMENQLRWRGYVWTWEVTVSPSWTHMDNRSCLSLKPN